MPQRRAWLGMFAWLWRGWFGDDDATLETREGMWGTFMVVYGWFLALQLLDLGSTLAVLENGGREANPYGPVHALQWLGPSGLLALKLVLVVTTMILWLPVVAWLQQKAAARGAGVVFGIILLGTLVYTAVVFWNLAVLEALR